MLKRILTIISIPFTLTAILIWSAVMFGKIALETLFRYVRVPTATDGYDTR
ncbi:MAG: hypothetical protein K2J80_13100 [Oscillospiraceae bacterium]|nr:hypothetical protein [Oscillospiraceae bacterium]